ncbi:MAG: hypothetical protein ACKOVI_06930, partial [Candidatus Planktophila sp.]
TTTVIALIGYSAMAGAVGGGGLGATAMSYGYNRFQTDVMIAAVVLLVIVVLPSQTAKRAPINIAIAILRITFA